MGVAFGVGDMAGLRFDSGDIALSDCVNKFDSGDDVVDATIFGQLLSQRFSTLISKSGM